MYKINNVIDGRTYCLHDQRDRNLRVIELVLPLPSTRQELLHSAFLPVICIPTP